jgi:hypothetical protein
MVAVQMRNENLADALKLDPVTPHLKLSSFTTINQIGHLVCPYYLCGRMAF